MFINQLTSGGPHIVDLRLLWRRCSWETNRSHPCSAILHRGPQICQYFGGGSVFRWFWLKTDGHLSNSGDVYFLLLDQTSNCRVLASITFQMNKSRERSKTAFMLFEKNWRLNFFIFFQWFKSQIHSFPWSFLNPPSPGGFCDGFVGCLHLWTDEGVGSRAA